LAPVERAERLTGGWDGTWFAEDYCEGPGQALIVNPRGEVKPCCGFASDLDQLTIGNVHSDTVARIVRRARRHPYVGRVFREGLSAIRDEILARDPGALPGASSNQCFFCWWVLTRGLASGVGGGGGRVGAVTGRPIRRRRLTRVWIDAFPVSRLATPPVEGPATPAVPADPDRPGGADRPVVARDKRPALRHRRVPGRGSAEQPGVGR